MHRSPLSTLLTLAIATGCIQDPVINLGEFEQPIIYGEDDRQEVLLSNDPRAIDWAELSVAIVNHASAVTVLDGGTPPSAGETLNWCTDERFFEQPAIALCSGILIAPDLVLTAGHCVPDSATCDQLGIMTHYFTKVDAGSPRVLESDLIACESVVATAVDTVFASTRVDFSVLRLSQRIPIERLPTFRKLSPQQGEPVATVGSSAGLPTKVAFGTITSTAALPLGYFDFTGDLFGGGSGSPVFDTDGALLGIHVRGGQDYERTQERCLRARQVSELDAGTSEQATAIEPILRAVCAADPDQWFCHTMKPPSATADAALDPIQQPDAGSGQERPVRQAAKELPTDLSHSEQNTSPPRSDTTAGTPEEVWNVQQPAASSCSLPGPGSRSAPAAWTGIAMLLLVGGGRRRRSGAFVSKRTSSVL